MVDRGIRGGRGRGCAAGLDDRRATLGDGRDEGPAQPFAVDLLGDRLAADLGVEQVRVLADAEWLPQMVILLTSATETYSFLATWVSARL